MEIIKTSNKLLAKPLVLLIGVYQRTLSPDHGLLKSRYPHGFCKFYPSCSEYARLSLLETGITTIPKIILRILRCNPFSLGGIDLPEKTTKI